MKEVKDKKNKLTKIEEVRKPLIGYQRFVGGKKVVLEASSLEEANKLFNKLTKS